MHDSIAVLDFGSQTAQLITRRVREARVYCELFPWDAAPEAVLSIRPKGFILSGGPASVYESDSPQVPEYVLESGLPVLGICYGMQALTHALGGRVSPASAREFGLARLHPIDGSPLLPPGEQIVWMSHGDRIEGAPDGFIPLAHTENAPIAAMGNLEQRRFGVQFHPEVGHTERGGEILRAFALEICRARPDWTPESILHEGIEKVRRQIGQGRAISALSGGVDSGVATALVQQAIGNQLAAVFVDTGLLRMGEREQIVAAFRNTLSVDLHVVDAASEFMQALAGVIDPEEKRRRIGELFIRTFEIWARQTGSPPFLVQGTIYPDVVESSAPDRAHAARIKTHHNVGGLPADMKFTLVEPLRYLFKDEVRLLGQALGLPAEVIWRQPFPGPGLAVRCLGEVTPPRLDRLRRADEILTSELGRGGWLVPQTGRGVAQAFAVLLPIRTVGVMGDQRTYQETIALRVVTTDDFMTADWARLPHEFLAAVANRIVNEVDGVNRVVYDITSKPPATIEWE
ncbi:MAG TPA: glutamine-hydrolyzing GMP synthase [Anaerolineales bacterium]|nr:glutamine-hydrolyzing GMP synthase [Anaerolineales bacterium]